MSGTSFRRGAKKNCAPPNAKPGVGNGGDCTEIVEWEATSHFSDVASRSMQAGAAFAHGISQQAFEHAAGIRVTGVISARVTPITKIPIDAAGFGD
jgi:hypothetical protein